MGKIKKIKRVGGHPYGNKESVRKTPKSNFPYGNKENTQSTPISNGGWPYRGGN